MDITTLIITIGGAGIGILLSIIGFFLKKAFSSIDEQREEINDIKITYLNKQEFLNEQAKIWLKLDKIMDILMEMKGSK